MDKNSKLASKVEQDFGVAFERAPFTINQLNEVSDNEIFQNLIFDTTHRPMSQ